MDSTPKNQKIEIKNVVEIQEWTDIVQFAIFADDESDFETQIDELLVENEFKKVYYIKRSETTWDCWFVP